MKLNTKILIITIIFGIQAILQLINGVSGFLKSASYGEYGNAFIMAVIMGYIAYLIYTKRDKMTYWFTLVFTVLVLLRSIIGIFLFVYSKTASLEWFIILINMIVFGIIPFVFLLNKELRVAFLSSKNDK